MVEQIKSKKNVKKQFFDVKSSVTNQKIQVYGATIEEMNGKVIILDLTRNLRGKNIVLISLHVLNGRFVNV